MFARRPDERVSASVKTARTAEGERLWELIRDRNAEITSMAVINPHLTEEMALYMLKARSTQADAVSLIAQNPRFKASYKIKLAVANHPNCPLKVALSILKHLRIFDLADITRNQFVKAELRKKIALMIDDRLSALPSGLKISLIRRSSLELVMRIMEKGDSHVIAACLDSPMMTEERLYRLIVRHATRAPVIREIAAHPRWSLRYDIRMALVRNFHTPMKYVLELIHSLRTSDLDLLYADEGLPSATRPFIYRELGDRASRPAPPEETPHERYEVQDDADEGFFDPVPERKG